MQYFHKSHYGGKKGQGKPTINQVPGFYIHVGFTIPHHCMTGPLTERTQVGQHRVSGNLSHVDQWT